MKLLLWVCESRTRLAIAAISCVAVLLAPAIPVADYIRNSSASPFGDMVIQTLWLFMALPAAYFTAVLVGDFVFPNRWRERVILGREDVADAALDDDDPAAALKAIRGNRSFKLPLYMLIVLLVLGFTWGIEAVTNGFLAEYQERGYFRTLMRTDRTPSKLALIEEQNDKRRESRVTIAVQMLTQVFQDPNQPPEVKKAALKTLGRLGRYLVTSIDSWNKKGSAEGHWEVGLLAWMQEHTAPPLRATFKGGDAAMKGHAAIALGKIRDTAGGKLLVDDLRARSKKTDSDYFATAVGLGFLHDFDLMDDLLEVAALVKDDVKAFRYVTWALGETSRQYQVYDNEAGEPPKEFDRLITLYAEILKTGKTAQSCAAAYLMDTTGHAGIVPHLQEAFDRPGGDAICTRHELAMDEPAPYVMGDDQPLQRAILYAFRNVGKNNLEVADWSRKRSRDMTLSENIRGHLESLARTAMPEPAKPQ